MKYSYETHSGVVRSIQPESETTDFLTSNNNDLSQRERI